jgi:hypothetical protein
MMLRFFSVVLVHTCRFLVVNEVFLLSSGRRRCSAS